MSQRGSAQLLLLSFRSRKTRVWAVGVIAGIVAAATLVHTLRHHLAETGLAQALRQSAWQHAFAKLPKEAPWPWSEGTPAATAPVPRLGVSASLVQTAGSSDIVPPLITPAQDPHLPPAKFGDFAIGDRITVTSSSGSSVVCRVTDRKALDPHLSDTGPDQNGKESLVTCPRIDPSAAEPLTLVIQSTKAEPAVESSPEL